VRLFNSPPMITRIARCLLSPRAVARLFAPLLKHPWLAPALAFLALALAPLPINPVSARTTGAATSIIGSLHVDGGRIVDDAGNTVRLLGVNRAGSEYACAQGWGVFDGPSDAASIAAIAAWHATVVRIPLNEDCWLGVNGVPAAFSGDAYRRAIASYVALIAQAGLVSVLDLHWSAPGANLAINQQPMPDADHAPAFWSSVAATFKDNPAVAFDLYNEPYGVSWACWRDGGSCSGLDYRAAGMQQLVSSVRDTGARNLIMVGGLAWANDLSQWLTYEPSDPVHNLAASWHVYNFNACGNTDCYDQSVAPVAAHVPIVASEIGESDCGHGFIDHVMDWLDAHGDSYIGWSWNVGDCRTFPSLINDYNGDPSPFGDGLKQHLINAAVATNTPSAVATNTPSAVATNTPSAVATNTPSATATASPSGIAFTSGFERADPQPDWTNMTDDVGYPSGGLSHVTGICCGLTGPESGIRRETAHGGSVALLYSGLARSGNDTYAYMKVFDLSQRPIGVDATTTLTYWIYPQSSSTAPVPVGGGNSSCVALDLVFTDGTNLRDSAAVDQHGARMHPAAQCGRLRLDSWNLVTSVIGTRLAGKSIARVDIGYDQPGGTGGYRGYIDDISVSS